jgi:hypothetical protein
MGQGRAQGGRVGVEQRLCFVVVLGAVGDSGLGGEGGTRRRQILLKDCCACGLSWSRPYLPCFLARSKLCVECGTGEVQGGKKEQITAKE